MKQTAVDFLANALDINTKSLIFKLAKELEKQQIEDANERGFVVGRKDIGETAVDYYEKTFKTVIK
jgi:predicted nucleic-acid-binding protein